MAYGRLDVFYPDGMFKTFLLNAPTTSLGRSNGCAIVLDTDTVSRYHFSLDHHDGQTTITDLDSAHGTFVDASRLAPNAPQVIYGGEEITIGELRLIYQQVDESPTRPMSPLDDVTLRVEAVEIGFRVDLESPPIAIAPGAHTAAVLTITNTSDEPERYLIDASGLPRAWLRMDRPEVELNPGENGVVTLGMKPSRRPDSKPGDYPVEVVVRPRAHPERQVKATAQLRLLPYSGFGMALAHRDTEADGRFQMYLHNQGSAPLTLSLTARDVKTPMRVTFRTPQVTLAPGQQFTMDGTAVARQRRWVGDTREHAFDVLARAHDASGFLVAARVYATDRPALPIWAALAGAGAAIAALMVALVVIVSLLRPATAPIIDRFDVSEQIEQGAPLMIAWGAQDARRYQVSVNGAPVFSSEDAAASSVQVDTSGFSGDVVVALTAANNAGETIATRTVRILRALQIDYFDLQPPQMVRYTVETLIINWSAPGAASTHLTGLDGFSSTPIQDAYAASGTISVAGIAALPTLSIVLAARGVDGREVTQTALIALVDPTCAARGEAASLRAGPDAAHPAIGTAAAGIDYVADAQDTSGSWLRLSAPGGRPGWGRRADFACAASFLPENLRKDLSAPTPPPTLIPTLTATNPLVPRATALTPTLATRPPSTGTATLGAAPRPTPTTAG